MKKKEFDIMGDYSILTDEGNSQLVRHGYLGKTKVDPETPTRYALNRDGFETEITGDSGSNFSSRSPNRLGAEKSPFNNSQKLVLSNEDPFDRPGSLEGCAALLEDAEANLDGCYIPLDHLIASDCGTAGRYESKRYMGGDDSYDSFDEEEMYQRRYASSSDSEYDSEVFEYELEVGLPNRVYDEKILHFK